MTTLAPAPALLDPVGGSPTLDELLVDAWEGLAAGRVAQCPVCGDGMDPDCGASGRSVLGRCSSCASVFS
jgi:hypothetical protein